VEDDSIMVKPKKKMKEEFFEPPFEPTEEKTHTDATVVEQPTAEDAKKAQRARILAKARAAKEEKRLKKIMEEEGDKKDGDEGKEEVAVTAFEDVEEAEEVDEEMGLGEDNMDLAIEDPEEHSALMLAFGRALSRELSAFQQRDASIVARNNLLTELERLDEISESNEVYQLDHSRNPFIIDADRMSRTFDMLPRKPIQKVSAFKNFDQAESAQTMKMSQRIQNAYNSFSNDPPTIMPGYNLSAGLHNPTFGVHSQMIKNEGGNRHYLNTESSNTLNWHMS
jgi:hypothetical protein